MRSEAKLLRIQGIQSVDEWKQNQRVTIFRNFFSRGLSYILDIREYWKEKGVFWINGNFYFSILVKKLSLIFFKLF